MTLCQCLEHRGQQQTHRAADAGAKQRWSNGIDKARNFRCRQKPICPRISRLVFCAVVLNVGKCQSATRCFVTVIVTDLYSEACPALQYFIRRLTASGGVLQRNGLSLSAVLYDVITGRQRTRICSTDQCIESLACAHKRRNIHKRHKRS